MKKAFILIITLLFTQTSKALEVYSDKLPKILDTLESIGLKCGTAQDNLKSKFDCIEVDGKTGFFRLKGEFKDYDQFLSAYMIVQSIAGVSKVSLVFDIFDTKIKVRNVEKCFVSLFSGDYSNECKIYKPIQASSFDNKVQKKHNKYALIIAVGKYKFLPSEKFLGDAPINDAELVKANLERKGYKVILLKNEEATKDNVLKTLDEIIAKLPEKEGTLYFYASSHGSPKDPNGETGIVLYDTSIENSDSCNTIADALNKNNIGDTKIRDILITAKKMCNVLRNSITLNEDIIPRLSASNKKIKFISNLDVCYSGIALKKAIDNISSDDIYSPDQTVAKYLTGIYPNPMIYISSASGEQLSMQRKFGDKDYGIFTYNFYKSLAKNKYNIEINYKNTLQIIKESTGEACRNLKKSRGDSKCDENGQNPLFFKNSLIKSEDFNL
ncbi:MAG: caspase family protein [Hydrogenothermaceae bacterium]